MANKKNFRRRKCVSQERISKSTVLAMLSESTQRDFYASLDDDQWSITSFNSTTREVCIDLKNNNGRVNKLAVTLPSIDRTPTDSP